MEQAAENQLCKPRRDDPSRSEVWREGWVARWSEERGWGSDEGGGQPSSERVATLGGGGGGDWA